jgi:hypothetical protein
MAPMAALTTVYWRDIPAQVIAKEGRRRAKRQLSERFEKAIDRAAMRGGARDSESYLADWRRGVPVACGEDLEAEAEAAVTRLEGEYTEERIIALVADEGWESG